MQGLYIYIFKYLAVIATESKCYSFIEVFKLHCTITWNDYSALIVITLGKFDHATEVWHN